jgi:dTDP-glucose 4,6-dehydratase
MKTIIVTGGLGFIGSNLINIISQKNYFIINIDKCSYASNPENIFKKLKNYKFYKEDIKNKSFIKSIFKKYNPSIIYNLAAETHVDKSIDNP